MASRVRNKQSSLKFGFERRESKIPIKSCKLLLILDYVFISSANSADFAASASFRASASFKALFVAASHQACKHRANSEFNWLDSHVECERACGAKVKQVQETVWMF